MMKKSLLKQYIPLVVFLLLLAGNLLHFLKEPLGDKPTVQKDQAEQENLTRLQDPIRQEKEVFTRKPKKVVSSLTTEEKTFQQNEAVSSLKQDEQQSLWAAFSKARHAVRPIAAHQLDFPENAGYVYQSYNPKNKYRVRYGEEGIRVNLTVPSVTEMKRGGLADRLYPKEMVAKLGSENVEAYSVSMKLASVAGVEISETPKIQPSGSDTNRMNFVYEAAGITEWYKNQKVGLEQGYTITQHPSHLAAGDVVELEIALDGLESHPGEEPGTLSLKSGAEKVYDYTKLVVTDALGKVLVSEMASTSNGNIRLAYQALEAVYPVTVDPLLTTEEAKLTAARGNLFGSSVSLSGDTVLVGTPGDNDGGSAYVFVRNGTTWSEQVKLTSSDEVGFGGFGSSVSISGDTAIVGKSGFPSYEGGAYIFVRDGTTWSEQAKLTASDSSEVGFGGFGSSVSVSEDTAIVAKAATFGGAIGSGSPNVAAYVFVRNGTTWSEQAKLTASSDIGLGGGFSGDSVSVSEDTVVVAIPENNSGGRSAYIFVRNGETWSEQAKLTSSDELGFGGSVSISGDTVIVGSTNVSSESAAYVFVRNGTTWSEQAKLTTIDEGVARHSVSVSGDSTIVVATGVDGSVNAYVFVRNGTTWSEQTKLTSKDSAENYIWGNSVSISGDTAIVGMSGNYSDGGSAYVFERSGTFWSEQAKLTSSDVATDGYFGTSVSLSGDTAIIGVSGDDDGGSSSGSAYVFNRNWNRTAWHEQAKLTASDAEAYDWFGCSVSLSGNVAVIGAYADDDGGSASGSAYTFVRSGTSWSEEEKLTASDAEAYDYFGRSVSLSGNVVVIGASGDDNSGNNSGSAYVFVWRGTTWGEQAKLTASDEGSGDSFGNSVSVSGDTLVVGAYRDDDGGNNSGSAYVFSRNGTTWSEQAKLTASNRVADGYFGTSVSLSGDTAVIGMPRYTGYSGILGSAYVFVRSGMTWNEQAELTASDTEADGYYGNSVSISGDTVVVGASEHIVTYNSGSAYIFERSGTTWSEQAKLTASDVGSDHSFGNAVSVSGDTVIIGAEDDDTGSVYLYRLTSDGVPDLLVSDFLESELLNNGRAAAFSGQLYGTSKDYIFTLTNRGNMNLDLYEVIISGENASDFNLETLDLSSNPDLVSLQSLEFAVSFNPSGTVSSEKTALVTIRSNDPDTSDFSFTVSGLALSLTEDLDNDGVTDWAEYQGLSFGFDWQESQPNLVNDYYAMAERFGLSTSTELSAVDGDFVSRSRDLVNQTVEFELSVLSHDDLDSPFDNMLLDPADVSINEDGNIELQLDASESRKFFRAGWKD